MDARVDAAPRAGAGRALHAVVLPMATIVLATSAHAQASPCDDYKAVLEARFEAAGVRGYSLEVVPAGAPVPPGTKVIANCEGGARKFLYRRWGGAGTSPSVAANAVRAASAIPAVVDAPARQLPPGAQDARTQTPSRASTATAVPVPRASEAKPATAGPVAKPATALPLRASEAAIARPNERVADSMVVAPPAAAAAAETAASAATTVGQRASAFATAHWPWLGGLAALVGGLWLWRARFGAYDKDGLPRGPRL